MSIRHAPHRGNQIRPASVSPTSPTRMRLDPPPAVSQQHIEGGPLHRRLRCLVHGRSQSSNHSSNTMAPSLSRTWLCSARIDANRGTIPTALGEELPAAGSRGHPANSRSGNSNALSGALSGGRSVCRFSSGLPRKPRDRRQGREQIHDSADNSQCTEDNADH